jgi:hypothetical protein
VFGNFWKTLKFDPKCQGGTKGIYAGYICKNFILKFSILNAYFLVSERSIAFKDTLKPSSDTFEVFGNFWKKLKFDPKCQGGTKGIYAGYICKNFVLKFSILNAYFLVSERSIAFKDTLELSSDTFEVFGKSGNPKFFFLLNFRYFGVLFEIGYSNKISKWLFIAFINFSISKFSSCFSLWCNYF